MAANPFPAEVIDLLSSEDEDEDEDEDDFQMLPQRQVPLRPADVDEHPPPANAFPMPGAFTVDEPANEAPPPQPLEGQPMDGGMIVLVDGEEVFIPDEEALPVAVNPAATTNRVTTPLQAASGDRNFTKEDCLRHVLEIFPDVSHDHVYSIWASLDDPGDYEALAGRARLDNIVEQLMSSSTYPKQDRGKLKRKRDSSADGFAGGKKWERADREAMPNWAKGSIAAICKADFPAIPRNHISDRLATHQFLFATYVALSKDLDDSEEGTRVFGRGRPPKTTTADAITIAQNCGHPDLVEELAAARLQVVAVRSQRDAAKVKKRAEEENLQKAVADGQTAECSACFDDLPMNRQIHCDGASAHFTCFECAENYIKSEVGDSRCKVLCPSGCGAGFAYNQLQLLDNKQLLEKLAQIQQEQDIREAGLDDLEECPFCDFKAIMPPIEEDFEFRCANPECERVSCRRCKAVTHVPISCEQHAKDNKLSSRHQIEEAMTAALIRKCNKCSKVFIKESGCNKMHCTSCGTLQCYVCSATVKSYDHFDQGGPRGRTSGAGSSKKCPLYDNVDERHEREVKEAEAKARAEIVESNPDVSAEDLEIKVSDAVKKAEDERLQRARQRYGGAYPGYMAYRMQVMPQVGRRLGGAGEGEHDDMMDLLGPNAADREGQEGLGEAELFENRMNRLRRQREIIRQARNRRAAGRVGDAAGRPAFPGLVLQRPGGQPPNNAFDAQLQAFMPFAGNGQQAQQQPQQPAAQQAYQQAANQPGQQQPLFENPFGAMDNYADPPNLFGGFGGNEDDPEARARQQQMQQMRQRQQQMFQRQREQQARQRAAQLMRQQYEPAARATLDAHAVQNNNNNYNNGAAPANPHLDERGNLIPRGSPNGPFDNYPDAFAPGVAAEYPNFFGAPFGPRVADYVDPRQRRMRAEQGEEGNMRGAWRAFE